MKTTIHVTSDIRRTPRVMQVEGIFDVPAKEKCSLSWSVDLPIEDADWNVGLIVGPSGCGKSTIARNLWGDLVDREHEWPRDKSVLDAFPEEMSVKDVVALMSSVGFSSPPSWLRPYDVLSNGERFRVKIARMLAEAPDLTVVDEYSSVVDRTVAKIGSAAIAKTVRRRGQKFIAVTCHEDVEEWLQPDWVYRPAEGRFARRSLQRRPDIRLEINRVHHSAWRLFSKHHYLSAAHNPAATAFVAFWEGKPVAFDSWLPFVGRLRGKKRAYRGHRTVCLPDYQGVGIGNYLFQQVARCFSGLGFRAFSNTAHPAQIHHRMKSPDWRMTAAPRSTAKDGGEHKEMGKSRAWNRLMASFEFIGDPMPRDEANRMLNTWAHHSR